jgi:hypothetical protein
LRSAPVLGTHHKVILYKPTVYVIPNSFHPLLTRLHRLVRKTKLGEFWTTFWRSYGHALVLDQSRVEWVIKAKSEGRLTNEEIARAQSISVSRVQQLHREYKRTCVVPVLRRAGRPKKRPDVSEYERETIKRAFERFRACACYLEPLILLLFWSALSRC